MVKRIILLSDGTGNSSAKAQKTNVWRLYEALDLTNSNQFAKYDDGVGTSSIKFLAVLGGAFGWGLKRNVIDLYKFVCKNYEKNDQISGFGFSRGAFTIRLLVGLITKEGLVKFTTEEELDRNARAAYRHYRKIGMRNWSPFVLAARLARDGLIWLGNWLRQREQYSKVCERNRKDIQIEFLGVWDTVSAYGVPIAEVKKAIDLLFWPMTFNDTKLSGQVKRACHALSLDEARATFEVVLWDERKSERPKRITQVWFPGVHANVGGGYPEDRLSYLSLHWMISQASRAGIRFIDSEVARIVSMKTPYARLYDSRAGMNMLYRYLPRTICAWKKALPIIDESVLIRMATGSDQYAPVPLHVDVSVMDAEGKLRALRGRKPRCDEEVCKPLTGVSGIDLAAKDQALSALIGTFHQPSEEAINLVRSTVWWRRAAYFVGMCLLGVLAFFPIIADMLSSMVSHFVSMLPHNSVVQRSASDLVSMSVDLAKGLLPSYATPWTRSFGAHPDLFVTFAALILVVTLISGTLKTRIHDRARVIWNDTLWPGYIRQRCEGEAAARNAGFLGAGAMFVAATWAANDHAWSFTFIESVLATILLLLFAFFHGAKKRSLYRLSETLERRERLVEAGQAPEGTPLNFDLVKSEYFPISIRVSTRIMDNKALSLAYAAVRDFLVPVIVGFLLLAGLFLAVNRAALWELDTIGIMCEQGETPSATFTIDKICADTGITLKKDATYQITLATNGDWFDHTERGDVGGFSTQTLRHALATPLRRKMTEDWFKPIAKIGEMGSDEYVLDPVHPFTVRQYKELDQFPFDIASNPSVMDHSQKILKPVATELMALDNIPPERRTLVSRIVAKSDGRLYLYVNDAMLFWNRDKFYNNNYGSATVSVMRVMPDGLCKEILPSGKAQAGEKACYAPMPPDETKNESQ